MKPWLGVPLPALICITVLLRRIQFGSGLRLSNPGLNTSCLQLFLNIIVSAFFCLLQTEVVLVVSRDSGGESAPIVVSGYDVQGRVLSEGEPIKDVYFILFSQTIQQKVSIK